MSQDLDTLLSKTKGRLFFQKKAGFLGPLMARVTFKWSSEIPTAAISKDTLYWNPKFFSELDEKSRVTVLAHELWHNGFLHGERLGDRCPDIWNIAADHVINLQLQADGYYMDGFPYVMDKKYTGRSTDEIYDDLIKSGKPMPVSAMAGDIMPRSAEDLPSAMANVISASTAARMSGHPGDIPGETTLEIDKFLNPKLPWEVLLQNWWNALSNPERTYARPNRRYDDPLIPGRSKKSGLEHLIYYLDISSSISDEQILRFNSEVKSVKEDCDPELLTLVTFDTQIHDEYEFEKDDPFEKIVVTGRGGTSLHDVFRHAQEREPTAIVIFSDLCVDIPDDPGIPILWVCIDNPDMEAPPYGKTIYLND